MTDYASVLEDKQDFMDQTDAANAASGGGADLSSVSVLNVAPTTSVKKAGLYDPRKPATASTSEGLYANRRAAMKAAGISFWDKPAYEDWDSKTRALMGVKKGDKFSSGQWMETFGSMKPDEINEAAGNVEYYLNDNLSVGKNKFTQDVASILGGISVPLSGGVVGGRIPASVRSQNPMDINSPYPYEKVEDTSIGAMRSLTQNQAANELARKAGMSYPTGTGSPSLLEAAGMKYNTPAGIAPFAIGSKAGAGAFFTPGLDRITLPSVTESSTSQKTRHELMHRLVQEMRNTGALTEIGIPQMEAILDKFNIEHQGPTTALDFMNFVSLETYGAALDAGMTTRSPIMDWDEDQQKYAFSSPLSYSMDWDPRRRDAGQTRYNWEGKPQTGQDQWDSWVAFQRELPTEAGGGAVAGAGGRTAPWGPATVWMDENMNPIGTGSGYANTSWNEDLQNVPFYQAQTGLENWPMGDEHALTAAQAARYPDSNYGQLARFNRSAALVAHPDSRVRAIHEAGLPDTVLDRMQDYLMETGVMWNQDMTYESAMDYLSRILSGEDMSKIEAITEPTAPLFGGGSQNQGSEGRGE